MHPFSCAHRAVNSKQFLICYVSKFTYTLHLLTLVESVQILFCKDKQLILNRQLLKVLWAKGMNEEQK